MYIHTYKGRGYDEGYHVAAFTLQKGMYEPMLEWCYQTFGNSGAVKGQDRWSDQIAYGEVRFRDEKDLMMFLLRWT